MRAPDDDPAATELRDGLAALLNWDGLRGLHSSGLAQWQMWILADRTGHLTVRRPAAKAVAKAPAKRTAKAAGGRRRKASGGA